MLIKYLVLLKGFSRPIHLVLHEFPQKCWNKNYFNVLVRRQSVAAVNFCLG